MRLFLAQLNPIVGATGYNSKKIAEALSVAKKCGASVAVFPELAISGYPPEDLLLEPGFLREQERALDFLAKEAKGIIAVIGTIRKNEQLPGKPLVNSACVIDDGQILGFQDKFLLPTYDVFDERRYFEPAKDARVWDFCGKRVGITVCEDIWPEELYREDPVGYFEDKKLDLLLNISASPYSVGKSKTRLHVAQKAAKRLSCFVALVNQVGAQDGLIFDGSSVVVAANGALLQQAKSFSEEHIVFDTGSYSTFAASPCSPGEELYNALVLGVRDYFHKQGFKKACIGLSGGIDSSVVAAIAVEALGKENVRGLFLPSRFTSDMSRQDAYLLAEHLEIALDEYSIEPAFEAFLETLGCPNDEDAFGITEENLQSRIRGMLLMAVANKNGFLVLNTGNKSEIAMGYTTLYGDSVGAIGVLGDLLKRQVHEVADYINREKEVIPRRAITREPTAELKYNQKDTDTLPEYPLLDEIVDAYVVHGRVLDADVVQKIHKNEYKRRQLPFALRVSEKAFSLGRKVPIVSKI